MKPIKPFTVPASTVKAPPVYKPAVGVLNGKLQAASRPTAPLPFAGSHPVNVKPPASAAVELRTAPPVYRPCRTDISQSVQPKRSMVASSGVRAIIQRMEGRKYFTGNAKDAEYRKRAEEDLGETPAHGSSKPGKDAGISGKTKNHEAKINEHIRAQKEKEYLASRPKPLIKGQAKKDDYEKALAKAQLLKEQIGDIGQRQEEFDQYLVNREYEFDEAEMDKLYAALGLFD